jgi:hydrogenase/urease accessory protein HupE
MKFANLSDRPFPLPNGLDHIGAALLNGYSSGRQQCDKRHFAGFIFSRLIMAAGGFELHHRLFRGRHIENESTRFIFVLDHCRIGSPGN